MKLYLLAAMLASMSAFAQITTVPRLRSAELPQQRYDQPFVIHESQPLSTPYSQTDWTQRYLLLQKLRMMNLYSSRPECFGLLGIEDDCIDELENRDDFEND